MGKKLPPLTVYLAAPVSGDIERNLERFERWFQWFIDDPLYENVSFLCPWYLYVRTLKESKHRKRGIRDDLAMVQCAHQIWGCALKFDEPLTEGMQLEFDKAKAHQMQREIYRTIDAEPPKKGEHLRRLFETRIQIKK